MSEKNIVIITDDDIAEIKKLLAEQKIYLKKNINGALVGIIRNYIENIIFKENDVVKNYFNEKYDGFEKIANEFIRSDLGCFRDLQNELQDSLLEEYIR